MRAAAAALTGSATLILPVVFVNKRDVDSPNDDLTSPFDRFGRVHQIAPDDVPTGMVIVRLHRPWASASFRFECLLRRRIEFSAKGKVRETLLCYIGMFVLAGLYRSSAWAPKIPTIPLKTFACSR